MNQLSVVLTDPRTYFKGYSLHQSSDIQISWYFRYFEGTMLVFQALWL